MVHIFEENRRYVARDFRKNKTYPISEGIIGALDNIRDSNDMDDESRMKCWSMFEDQVEREAAAAAAVEP